MKFNLKNDVFKEKLVFELEQIYNKNINTTNNLINNFGILVTSKDNIIGEKRKISDQIIDNISIKCLQTFINMVH